ncbi:hypothetical protein MBANPS3_010498 [Mucor bainieri]
MSSSGLIAARKRLENAIKKYDIPTEPEPIPADKCKDGVLLLSLLQSRLNWTNAVFARYKTDPVQQPKRSTNTRKKWPNMKYLGTCNLQLGAHLYDNTNFYEATRTESWKDIAIKEGLMQPPPPPLPPAPAPAPAPPSTSTPTSVPTSTPPALLAAQVNPENKPDVVMQDATPQPDSKPDVIMEEAEKNAMVPEGSEEKDTVMEEVVQQPGSEAVSQTPVAVPEQITTAGTTTTTTTTTNATADAETDKTPQEQPETASAPITTEKTQAETTSDSISKEPESIAANVDPQASTSTASQQQSVPPPPEATQPEKEKEEEMPDAKLTFVDVVFEIKEFPNERFIFPKDAIIQSTLTGPNPDDCFIIASFVLPLDMSQTDEFFQKPKEKILKYGEMCPLPCISDYYRDNTARESRAAAAAAADPPLPLDSYQPVNIRMTHAKLATADALKAYVHKPEVVRKSMKDKIKYFPKRTYLKFDVSDDETRQHDIRELIKRASVAPDISTGPVQAEKKRNEILNAIRLGKRERDEKFESELPKNKMNARDDGFMKCAYCSTKQTSMWRSGPNGHGTLCNSCGLQWRRGEILVGAPVISPEEEKQRLKEKRERDKITEALELERAEKEEEKLKKKAERHHPHHHHHHHEISYTSGTFAAQLLQQRNRQRQLANIPSAPVAPVAPIDAPAPAPGTVTATAAPPVAVAAAVAAAAAAAPSAGTAPATAPVPVVAAPAGSAPVANPAPSAPTAAVAQQPKASKEAKPKKAPRARKSKAEASAAKKAIASAPAPTTASVSATGTPVAPASAPASAAAPATTSAPQQAIQAQQPPQQTQAPQATPVQTPQQPAPVPLSLYNPAGIPLPTLSIDFAGHLQFAHPNCGITLLDRDFSVRLCKDGCEQTTVKFEKKDLTNAVFEVVTEGEAALKREVLRMKIVPATAKKITAFGKNIKIDKKNGVHIRFLEKLDPSGGAVVQRILQRWLVTEPQQ